MKILIVEDEPTLVDMYKTKFELEGFAVETAINGEEGLEKVHQNKPDIILLDILMPEVNGLVMLRKLKEDEQTKSITIVLLTNVSKSDETIQKGLELGAVAYLIKADHTPEDVVNKVKELYAEYGENTLSR